MRADLCAFHKRAILHVGCMPNGAKFLRIVVPPFYCILVNEPFGSEERALRIIGSTVRSGSIGSTLNVTI